MSENLLFDLQADIAARLAADEYFAPVAVLVEHLGDVDDEIQRALGASGSKPKAGKYGAVVVVLPLIGTVEHPNPSTPVFKLDVTVLVLEKRKINKGATGTNKAASAIARRVAHVLHQYDAAGLAGPMMPAQPTEVPVKDADADVAYEVRFTCQEKDPDRLTKVATPSISPAGGTAPQSVTMSCGTAGATIIYTTNGNPPYQGQAGAMIYTGAVSISGACRLRASAFKAGCLGSNAAMAQFD